ncbi:MAG: ABC transporter substrate-binding protein [Rhodospirillales bacterium]|jgi:peptide/nickel transport system substrate-binding protein|nr:ABC transporter substrate-binding protein [Rhodospirillales bacterium]
MKKVLTTVAGALTAAVFVGGAWAETLTIGTRVPTHAVDPHFSNSPPDLLIGMHFFDHLIFFDERQQLKPGLATSWKPIDDTTWELKLRKGVKFHDGSPFTADDALFTVSRAGKVEGSSSSPLRFFTAGGKKMVKVDDYTIHVKTNGTYVLTPQDLAVFAIVSKKHGEGASLGDYSSGKAVVGTGPYKLVDWASRDHVNMVANPNYWGGKMQWDKVTFKAMTSDPSRVAALLNGDVDLIDFVPTADIGALRKNSKFTLHESPSNRVIFFELDQGRDQSTMVKTNDGKPYWPNPLRDWRVRKAISMAINRDAIVGRVMEGLAIKANQLLPDGFFGIIPDLPHEKFDLEGAKKLMKTAGYGDGFQLTLTGPNDRYVNDAKIVEAVAQMLTRLGLKTSVRTFPRSVYFSRARKLEYSFSLKGYGSDSGEVGTSLINVIGCWNAEKRFGRSNAGRYCNPRFDIPLDTALQTLDDKKREKIFQDITRIAMEDVAIIPLHYQKNVWASKKGLHYVGRTDEFTLSRFVTKK